MAIRNIIKLGDSLLTKPSREAEISAKTCELLDDLIETVRSRDGLGLAAPQVGILRRLAVIDNEGEILELINPEILEEHGKSIEAEGCLSVPGRFGEVERPQLVVVGTYDRKGDYHKITLEDMSARAACHEIDHLNGKLFVDKVIRFLDDNDFR